MNSILRTCLLLLCHIALAELALPLGWKVCEKTDPERNKCLQNEISKAIQGFINGNKLFEVPVLDPLRLGEVWAGGATTGPVKLDFVFKDYVIYNLKTMVVSGARTEGMNLILDLDCPEVLVAKSPYVVNGTVYDEIITGEGNGTFEFLPGNYTYIFTFSDKPLEKDGKKYLVAEKAKFITRPGGMKYVLDHLYNGDKAHGDRMNKILNDHWEAAWNGFKPHFEEFIANRMDGLLNRIFSHVPMDEINLF